MVALFHLISDSERLKLFATNLPPKTVFTGPSYVRWFALSRLSASSLCPSSRRNVVDNYCRLHLLVGVWCIIFTWSVSLSWLVSGVLFTWSVSPSWLVSGVSFTWSVSLSWLVSGVSFTWSVSPSWLVSGVSFTWSVSPSWLFILCLTLSLAGFFIYYGQACP